MPTKLIISLFIALCAVFVIYPAAAQKKDKHIPATHMWVKTGLSTMTFVPVRSLKDCETFTRQAATLNSASSSCFNNQQTIGHFDCTKPVRESAQPSCK